MLPGVVARGPVHAMLFTPDSHYLYTVDGNRLVQCWSIPDMTSDALFKHQHRSYGCRLFQSLDGNSLLLGEGIPASGRYWCWDRSLDRLVYPGDISIPTGGPFWFTSKVVEYPCFTAEDRIYFLEMPERFGLSYYPWPPIGESAPLSWPPNFPNQQIYSLLADPSGRMLAILFMDKTLLFWDRLNPAHYCLTHAEFLTLGRHFCQTFSGDGSLYAITSPSGTRIFRTDTGQLLRVIRPTYPPKLLVFHPSGRYLVGGDTRAAIIVWEVETGVERQPIYWKIGRLRSLAFSSDGLLCAAGGTQRKFVIWDFE